MIKDEILEIGKHILACNTHTDKQALEVERDRETDCVRFNDFRSNRFL